AATHLSPGIFNQGYYRNFFVEEKKLGRGLRGSVFLCQHVLDKIPLGLYAVKKVAVGDNKVWLERMLREVKLLETLRHPNIIDYKHSWIELEQLTRFGPKVPCLFILMDCANGGNLEEYIEGSAEPNGSESASPHTNAQLPPTPTTPTDPRRRVRHLSLLQIYTMFHDICQGLLHLHTLGIIHRDIKPQNLLLHYSDHLHHHQHQHHRPSGKDPSAMPRVILSDFGECEDMSHLEQRDRTGATGTLEYMAPELLQVDQRGRYLDAYSVKADVWSLGMILYYLCYSKLPFTQIDNVDILRSEILGLHGIQMPAEGQVSIPRVVHELITTMLNPNPDNRPNVIDIL
ncbi:kinase-like domain-containing protein, partial [Dimargaris cristalligena]